MPKIITVLTTKDGQGSTTQAVQIAWTLAGQDKRVLLIDCDMSGTGNVADHFNIERGDKSLYAFLYKPNLAASDIERQAVQHPRKPGLWVVPGLRGGSGYSVFKMLPVLRQALENVPFEYVVLDIGAPLAHPDISVKPNEVAEVISAASHHVLVVVKDSPAQLINSVLLLHGAQFPAAELVLVETTQGQMRDMVRSYLRESLPWLEWKTVVPWDHRRQQQAEHSAEPLSAAGVIKALHLAD